MQIPAEFRPDFQIPLRFRSFWTERAPFRFADARRNVTSWRHDKNTKDVAVYPEERRHTGFCNVFRVLYDVINPKEITLGWPEPSGTPGGSGHLSAVPEFPETELDPESATYNLDGSGCDGWWLEQGQFTKVLFSYSPSNISRR